MFLLLKCWLDPNDVPHRIEKAIMKFIWKNKRPRIAKAILSKKSEAGGITISELKLYHRAIVTKIWHQNRQVDQWYRIEETETNPHTYNYFILKP